MDKIFRILSIDGGGIRGIFPAHILKCVSERLNIDVYKTFDMIAGTSTGSIIAAAIASEVPISQIVDLYKIHGKSIFPPYKSRINKKVKPAFRSIYTSDYFKKVLADVFGESTLGKIRKPLIIPATDIGTGGVHVFKSSYSDEFTRDKTVKVKDAVLASCSAPTFFDPYKVNEYLLADGGLWANNPGLAAVIDAQKRLNIQKEKIKILSLGTGNSRQSYGTNPNRRWGLMKGWRGPDFITFMLSLQSQSTVNYLKLILAENQIVRIDFETDLPLPIDDISILDDLICRADKEFTYNSSTIRNFFDDGGGIA
jgi:uncharacterized protein